MNANKVNGGRQRPLRRLIMSNQYNNNSPGARDWGSALIIACFGLGFAMSWGTYEMRQRVAQEVGAQDARHEVDILNGQQSDLGRLLADPRTILVRLTATEESGAPGLACVAWNQQTQTGAVFCGDLAVGNNQHYLVWLVPSSGAATTAVFGPAQSGRSVYLFSPTSQAAPPVELILTPQTESTSPRQALARGKVAG
jgi:hypothetical protein